MMNQVSTSMVIMIITIVVSLAALNNENLYHQFILNPRKAIYKKQIWRFITSGFIHGGIAHLGFNMFTFFFFARSVEYTLLSVHGINSSLIFLIFYLSAIIVSDLPIAWKNRNNPHYNSLGASGGVSAIIAISILFSPTDSIYLFAFINIPGFIYGAVFLIYSYYQSKNSIDNVNHEAHIYGFLYGLLIGLVIYPGSGDRFLNKIFG